MSYRWGLCEEVLENRKQFFAKLDITPERCVQMYAGEHPAARISLVYSTVKGRGMFADDALETDALVTNERGLGLVLLVADCLPVFIVDSRQKVIALLHLGWRSTAAGLAERTVRFMQKEFGCESEDMFVFLGPGIHADSYRFTEVKQKDDPVWRSYLREFPDGTTGIDLYGFNRQEFLACGISEKQIEESAEDTAASFRWFSHYRAKKTGEAEGRFAAFLMLE